MRRKRFSAEKGLCSRPDIAIFRRDAPFLERAVLKEDFHG